MSAANTNAARSVAFQTKRGAEAHAIRCAREESPTRRCSAVAYRAVEGGRVFQFALGPVDWEVREIPAAELPRLVQSGIRAAIQACEVRAQASDLAAEQRDQARALETKLTVSQVRRVVSDEDAFEASNRALPAELQRD